MSDEDHDVGDGHSFRFVSWSPDRELNPQYEGVPDMDPCGIIERHPDQRSPGEFHEGAVMFEGLVGDGPRWQVVSLDPLHLEPSILCDPDKGGCGSHGFIREGRWVSA